MSSSAKRDRLSPPLMLAFRAANAARDAKTKIDLRNEHGERLIAGRRVSGRTPISETVLRKEVARDLESLMNTVALESTEDLVGFARVQRSILNYGFPDIAHRSIDEISVDDLGDEIRQVLMTYEPRLDRASIRTTRDMSARPEELKLRFVVHADLRCDPLNVPVEFVADVDLDSGGIQINRL
ncbi:MAG: type secretion system protein ImpF [Bradyrhizobium sp.]|nr:type secretion system protein ImpF [Bradyrhizobium sp.]